jgi:F-type H+-transporting ATPase subunit delta
VGGRNGAGRAGGYAAALFEVAKAEGLLETVEEELFIVSRTIAGDDRLREALSDPAVPTDRRLAVVDDLLQRTHPLTRNLVAFLVMAGRVRELPAIVDDFLARAAAERQRVVAEVTSAIRLDDGQRRRLGRALSRATGRDVDVHVMVDPGVLGGVRSRVGDRVIDGTVRARLRQLRDTLERPADDVGLPWPT